MLQGDTVRLCVQFRDYNGNMIAPENVKLTIYDINKIEIETITEDIEDLSQGSFYYDYTADSDFIFEFSGIYFGKPVVARQLIQVKFN